MSIFRNDLPPQSPVRSDNTRVTGFDPPQRITTHMRVHCDLYTDISPTIHENVFQSLGDQKTI